MAMITLSQVVLIVVAAVVVGTFVGLNITTFSILNLEDKILELKSQVFSLRSEVYDLKGQLETRNITVSN